MFEFYFEWNPAKALGNQRKHRVSFNLAATVFNDPLILSIPNKEHGKNEERWSTVGQAENGKTLVIIHTYQEVNTQAANVRIISARPATKHEQRQYEASI